MLRLVIALLIVTTIACEAKRVPQPFHRKVLLRTLDGHQLIRSVQHAPRRKPIRHIIGDSPTIPTHSKYVLIE